MRSSHRCPTDGLRPAADLMAAGTARTLTRTLGCRTASWSACCSGIPSPRATTPAPRRCARCAATLVNGYGFIWGLEASEVFEMDLPEVESGACPPDGVPVYRVRNQRADSNHRYSTSIAIR